MAQAVGEKRVEAPLGAAGFPAAQFGLWVLLAAVMMLFIGFTSAYIVRRGAPDWQALQMPRLLWLNSLVLLVSSATMYAAQRAARSGAQGSLRAALTATLVLGALFLIGQWQAWHILAAQGVFLASSPASSFFFVLTGTHAVHLLAGLLFLVVLAAHAWVKRCTAGGSLMVELCATYWHFMDGLWVYLAAFLFLLRA